MGEIIIGRGDIDIDSDKGAHDGRWNIDTDIDMDIDIDIYIDKGAHGGRWEQEQAEGISNQPSPPRLHCYGELTFSLLLFCFGPHQHLFLLQL